MWDNALGERSGFVTDAKMNRLHMVGLAQNYWICGFRNYIQINRRHGERIRSCGIGSEANSDSIS